MDELHNPTVKEQRMLLIRDLTDYLLAQHNGDSKETLAWLLDYVENVERRLGRVAQALGALPRNTLRQTICQYIKEHGES